MTNKQNRFRQIQKVLPGKHGLLKDDYPDDAGEEERCRCGQKNKNHEKTRLNRKSSGGFYLAER